MTGMRVAVAEQYIKEPEKFGRSPSTLVAPVQGAYCLARVVGFCSHASEGSGR